MRETTGGAAPKLVGKGGYDAPRSPLHEGAAAFERVAAAASGCLGRRGSAQLPADYVGAGQLSGVAAKCATAQTR